jgi:2-dehydropantoate 2-reductase
MWEVQINKISVNSLGYTSALSRSNFANECLMDPRWRRTIAVPMLAESERVLAAAGITIAHVPGPSDVLRLRKALKLLDKPLARYPISWLIRRRGTPRLIYSVEQDLLRGRPTEIDFVNGEIVRLGKQYGVDALLHQLSVDIAHELEQRHEDRFLSRDEVIQRFASLLKSQLRIARFDDALWPTVNKMKFQTFR